MSTVLLTRPLRPLSTSLASCCLRSATGSSSTGSTASTSTTTGCSSTVSSGGSYNGSTKGPTGYGVQQCRHESTTRRHTQRLRIPPSPSFTPDAAIQRDHIVFNPPSAAPNVYHTPLKFLPPGDRRRELAAITQRLSADSSATSPIARTGTPLTSASAHTGPYYSSSSAAAASALPLPPAIRQPYEKKYHLTPADIEQIRALRAEDPATWTRERLAAKFECSQFFVGLVAPAPERGAQKAREIEDVKRKWGRRKREAREDRGKRKELWGRDV